MTDTSTTLVRVRVMCLLYILTSASNHMILMNVLFYNGFLVCAVTPQLNSWVRVPSLIHHLFYSEPSCVYEDDAKTSPF